MDQLCYDGCLGVIRSRPIPSRVSYVVTCTSHASINNTTIHCLLASHSHIVTLHHFTLNLKNFQVKQNWIFRRRVFPDKWLHQLAGTYTKEGYPLLSAYALFFVPILRSKCCSRMPMKRQGRPRRQNNIVASCKTTWRSHNSVACRARYKHVGLCVIVSIYDIWLMPRIMRRFSVASNFSVSGCADVDTTTATAAAADGVASCADDTMILNHRVHKSVP